MGTQMRKFKFFTLLQALTAAFVFAVDIPNDIPTFCVTYPTDSSYRIHLVNHPKKLKTNQRNSNINTFFNFPRNITNVPNSKDIYPLNNAKKILSNFYGQFFRGSQSEVTCNKVTKRTEQEFEVLLIGPCEKNIPVAHYCLIEGAKPTLHRTEIFENVPETYLFESDPINHSYSYYCSGTSQIENVTVWNFSDFGKFTLRSSIEEDSCHAQSEWFSYNKAYFPKQIDFSADTTFKITTAKLKTFYGKQIPITWDISAECGFNKEQKHFEPEILITGKCPSKIKRIKKSESDNELWLLHNVKIHGQYNNYETKEHSNECTIRKVR